MIVRPQPNLLQLFFLVQGSVVQRIFPQALLIAALSVAVVWAHHAYPGLVSDFNSAPFTVLGIALSIFMGFRNNACYDRWWEARRHWGELICLSRNLARQTQILPCSGEEPERSRQKLLRLAMAFAQALVLHLRPGSDTAKVTRHLTAETRARYEASCNAPEVILSAMQAELAALHRSGELRDIPFQIIDRTIGQMAMVQAACERIRSTPVPFGYSLLLHRTAYVFCLLLPFGFANTLGWLTPFATALAAYTFFGLDALGSELEEPFGQLPNDLPIAALADTIEINLREALGETDLPPLPKPVNHILV
ncbi:bestrophin family protein [Rhodopseudomonas palustris]|uniref:bestrophin family protein n=1 Tax=Rhodopseudomonas palustris TaxID=1076 RepID=UPI0021F3A6D9|nr:bestrophin family protein [Rhodopseudomonas palustris]UYO42813.1 bestrophin family protein [Rhodopseudomonas palustris]